MNNPDVLPATPDDRARVVATLVAAFREDPAVRWMFPDDDVYEAHMPHFAGGRFDRRMPLGAVWTVEGGAAVALWSPPGGDGGDPHAYPAGVTERLTAYDEAVHGLLPAGPHWYLGMLATDPACRGKGLGRAAMIPGMARARLDGVPAFLETSNLRNVAIYQGAGWRVVGETAVAGLPIWVLRHG
ncbi:hypothetical protein Val02_08510 [Virgisporangium aliadipatigenens]|uniref:N-acetyltransferase domain-containing protein n=1 Tax=Virgisporangium aliadipatigenens TaxID=741659 RepID=A0A8J3YH91_9ACTN|nr:GNAT family N-acetyltransferase [Virgisporangium aliadipatigenens]GIJ43965.1 hypothetical protein Val02_08510 [Virgisporangium aliadipatigenens]